MPYYPILVDLKGKKVIVVGGGAVAQRKIETLLEYGAEVQVISQALTPALTTYVDEEKIELLGPEFQENQLNGAFMVIAATNDSLLNHQVSEVARGKGLLINAVDQPPDCNFIVPSILRRGDLLIAVSTSGKSPALARKVRKELEKSFGSEYESLLLLMGRLRKEIISRGLSQEENRQVFYDLINSHILEAMGSKDWNEVATILNKITGTQLSSQDVIEIISQTSSPLKGET
jgi:precorrin-2 dehydrogenase/sirohydrochlorin ferrochelatase